MKEVGSFFSTIGFFWFFLRYVQYMSLLFLAVVKIYIFSFFCQNWKLFCCMI